jgi:hypothetical protein
MENEELLKNLIKQLENEKLIREKQILQIWDGILGLKKRQEEFENIVMKYLTSN